MLKIAVIGSGWGSSSFIKYIDKDKYDVKVISPNNHFIYTPLLANNIKNKSNIVVDINNISVNNNGKIKYIKNTVTDFDFNKNTLFTKDNTSYTYDYLVMSHGSDINTFNIDGVKDNCYFIKSVEDVDIIRNKLQKLPENSKIAVIGCGLTGTEIIANLIDYNKFKIIAIEGLDLPLSTFNSNIRKNISDFWKDNNVTAIFKSFVKKIDNDKIYFNGDNGSDDVNYDMVIWCGGIKSSILSNKVNSTLDLNCRYGIPVDNNMKVINTENIFAIGDCAYNKNPPTAQVAYKEGKYLAEYINNISKINNTSNINKTSNNGFVFNTKGQFCYIGNGNSVYEYNNDIYFSGVICGYINKLVHLYNAINFEQVVNLLWY